MKKFRFISFQTIVRLFLQAISVLTFIVAIGWFIFEPGFDAVIAILTSIVVFLSPLFLGQKEKAKDKTLPPIDECEYEPEFQLDAFPVSNAEMGGGGMANFLHDYQVYFGGRHDEMAELDAWLTQTDKPFGLLVAPAGMGKSALVANWSKCLQESGKVAVVYHPISLRYGTNNQKQTLRSLLIQMSDMARREAALVPEMALYEHPQEGDDESLLISQLRENLRRSTGWSKPLVVVIDGLDELANQLNQPDIKPVDFLPNHMEKGIYILAVARGESSDVRDKWQRALGWEKSPVHSFTLETLQKKDIREMVSQSGLSVENDFLSIIADKIYELSEKGDPLIASLWLDWLAKQSDKESDSLLEDLKGQSPGINTYIEGILSQINPLVSEGARTLFEVLSLARGPLAAGDLYALGIKIDSGQLDRLVNLSGRLIIRNDYAYVFSHSRIRQAVEEKFVSLERRQYWLEQFHKYGRCSLQKVSKTPGGKIPNYILNYYAEHLYLDKPNGYEASLYALINKVWMTAHYEHSGSYDGFLVDVDRALSISRITGMKQAFTEEVVDQISLQIKGLMCHASITSLSANLSPHLPALLVRDAIWKPQQAVSHVQRIANLAQRVHALVSLLTVEESGQVFGSPKNQNLLNTIISSSLRDMQHLWQQNKVDEAELYHLQLDISPFLSAIHVDEALLLAGKVQRSIWRARLLAELLPLIEDERHRIQTIKKIIHACSKINESLCSDDIPFIVSTFTIIAQNLSMEQLAIAFAEVWKEESPENRTRKKCILDYLAWHIEKHQAMAFVELLFDYDTLPQVAEKICRFARRLDDEIAYDIAFRLEKKFASVPKKKRQSYGMGSIAEGVGMAFITLALSIKGEHQQKILQITSDYIQTYGAEDAPYGEQDLWLFYQMISGDLTDKASADLVKQGKFMFRFWQNRGDSSKLSMYSQEIIAYLGIETLKVLFERCIKSKSDGAYWHITESPYILPAISEKLRDEELSLIYEIGHARGESCGYYGYIRAVSQSIQAIKRMSEESRLETIHWAISRGNLEIERAVAPLITPEIIPGRYQRHEISEDVAGYLPTETVSYIVRNFDKSYYGETRGTEVLLKFVHYLPQAERVPILQSMKAELFQIKDNGELNKTIKALEQRVKPFTQRRMKRISRSAKTEMNDAYLLADLEEEGLVFSMIPVDMIPFAIEGSSFRRHVFHAPISFFRAAAKPIRLLRLNKNSYQVARKYKEKLQKQTESPNFLLLDSWLGRLFYRTIQQIASSRFIWILYLLCIFVLTIVLLLISFIVALLILPFIVLFLGGFLLRLFLELSGNWLKTIFGRSDNDLGQYKHKANIWKSIQNQVHTLNHLPESKDREEAFVQIAHKLGNVVRLTGSLDYKEYAAKAEEIWSELRPEFVLDALAVLDKHAYDESHDYVRTILPAVVLKHKSRLPDLIRHIEKPYVQLQAIQYACLSYFFKGQERLDYLKKSVSAFSYTEMPDFIIPHILTEISDYATPDLIPHLLHWLLDYPVASALEKLAPKIVGNDAWLTQGFAIAQKTNDSVHGFVCNIAPSLDKDWVAKSVIFVIERDLAEEQEKCMPVLVDRWLKLSQQEIYAVWQDLLEVMKGYPRSRVLTQLGWFSNVIVRLAGPERVVDVTEEILAVWSWWDVVWKKPTNRLAEINA